MRFFKISLKKSQGNGFYKNDGPHIIKFLYLLALFLFTSHTSAINTCFEGSFFD
jgi:hypothetical protein